MQTYERKELELFCAKLRLGIVRQIASRGFGHLGGSMSIVELLAVLYCRHIRFDLQDQENPARDILVLSKGHAGPALYAALALKGFFPWETLETLNQPPTILPSHCDRRLTPGVDMTTGSLGQGMGVAAGAALGAKARGSDAFSYAIIGDGECNEGQIWEAAMFATQQRLGNLVCYLDRNHMQNDGPTELVCDVGDAPAKFRSFGWQVLEVDGHDLEALDAATLLAKKEKSRPSMVVMETKKGKGSPVADTVEMNHFMSLEGEAAERECRWHEEQVRRLEREMEAEG